MTDTPTALDRIGWAMRAPLDDATVWRVLLTLTNHADATGLAYPRVTTIAAEVRRGERQTRAALDRLATDGYIDRVRLRSGGRLRGYLYRVLVPGSPAVDPGLLPRFAGDVDLPDTWSRPVTSGGRPPVTSGDGPPVDQRRPAAGQEPPTVEPPTREPTPSSSDLRPDADDQADPAAACKHPDAARLTRTFAAAVVANGHTVPRPGTKAHAAWYRDMDRLLRLGPPGDGQQPPDPATVERVIGHVAADTREGTGFPGWAHVVLSPGKLRAQWTRLAAEAARPSRPARRPSGPSPSALDAIRRTAATNGASR